MKKSLSFAVVTACVLLSSTAYAASFDCTKAKSWTEKTICDTRQLSNLDDLLGSSFKKALATSSSKTTLKNAQHDWLINERNRCTDVECLKTAYTSRIAVLNEMVASAEAPAPAPAPSTSEKAGQWYQTTAKPSLVVRAEPKVTGKQVGNIPTGGKVKVLAATGKSDFIGGRDGSWVKIEWQDKTAYVFDAFLEKIGSQTSSNSNKTSTKPSTSTGKTLTGEISAYDCGDNCYLTVTDSKSQEHIGLCTAATCDTWNENASMPANYLHKKVQVTVGKGTQVDGAGNTMGEMDAFDMITFLK